MPTSLFGSAFSTRSIAFAVALLTLLWLAPAGFAQTAAASAATSSASGLPPTPSPTLVSVAVAPLNLVGGLPAIGTVIAGSGAAISLSSNNPAVQVPSDVSVGASGTTNFPITTTAVSSATPVTITASQRYATGASGVYQYYTVMATLTVNPVPVSTSIAVSPASATLTTGGTQTFTAVAKDQNGTALAMQPAFTWTVTGVGSVSSAGVYSAGSTAGSATVMAASGTVSGTAAVTVNSAVAITNINNGDTLANDKTLGVNVLSNNGLVTMAVDGVDISTENVVLVPGQNKASFPIETNSFSNGTHVITVHDSFGNSDTRTVTFSNALSSLNYNPMFDRTPGVTDIANACHITGTFSSPQSWTVSITDDSNNPVNSFSGSGTAVDITWNGTNAKSQVMPADDYLVTITGSGTVSSSSSVAGATPNAASSTSTTFLVNVDNYADSIILLHTQTIQSYSGGTADTIATARSKAIAYKHFLHAELDRFVGTDFHYPVLVSILDDYDFVHDPKLVGRIQNKFRRPATSVYIDADGDYHDYNGDPLIVQISGGVNPKYYTHYPTIHPYFDLGGYRWCSQYASNQVLSPKDINVGALTASAGYTVGEGVAGNGPFVWIDTCDSTAGDGIIGPGNNLIGNDPMDYQWALDFGINGYGFGGGVYFGSVLQTPRIYISGLPGHYGEDWSYWRQNLFDFLCAGGNNFQTALNRSYDIQSFTTQPTPPNAMVWIGFGQFAF